ncbi:MAG: RNA polymerase sigma factor RpoD/SigA [Spirochaetota bacterium]|nr:RNA polymerase sigma factor RpoD/SigA [Spirochaetota bacterium]
MKKINAKIKKAKNIEFLTDPNSLKTYIQEIDKIKILTKEEEDQLAREMNQGSLEARERLIASNLRFVVSIAKHYINKGVPFLDLINEGNMGLILACDKFDYRRGYRFISYAVWWIRQYIAKAFAEQVGLIRLPMNRALQHFKIKSLINENEFLNNSDLLSNLEIANKLDMKEVEVDTIIRATRKYVSIDAPVNQEKGEKKTIFLEDVLLDTKNKLPEEEMLEKHLKDSINNTLKTLSEKEQLIINYRFGLNGTEALSLSEIGRRFNVTKERIRQIEKRAIKKLKQPFIHQNLKAFMAA